MIYPNFLKRGDYLGVTAPSDGNKKETDYIRLEHGIKKLMEKDIYVLETENVRTSQKGRSSDGRTRAKELEGLFCNPNVRGVIAAKGGDFLMEMLSYLDFSVIQKNPKWVQGYSDVTGLLFTITTNYDIATIYGNNFNDFGMESWHEAVKNNLDILMGKIILQNNFQQYEDGFHERITGIEGYVLEKPVVWKIEGDLETVHLEGRLLGGCLDVLLNLVGTRFDKVKDFISKYKEDGILWFLESFDLNSEGLIRGLWQLKEAGWFEHAKGFVFGRPAMYQGNYDISYEEAVCSVLGELELPMIFDADIGHKTPQFTMVNGALAIVKSSQGRGSVNLSFV